MCARGKGSGGFQFHCLDLRGPDPKGSTADGADCIAALRYAIMSWWQAPKDEVGRARVRENALPPAHEFDRDYYEVLENHPAQTEWSRRRRAF